jgi:ribosomal protein S18 acetylase RimI-like enzyme
MSGPDWTLRDPTADDAAQLREVVTAAGIAAWASFLGEERIRDANRGHEHPADLVAVDDGVFGFVSWDVDTGEITRLYTHPRRWGSGAARALLGAALDALEQAGRAQAWLYTEARNERAIAFYEQQGWRREGDARVRDWHGARLCEPRFAKALPDRRQ